MSFWLPAAFMIAACVLCAVMPLIRKARVAHGRDPRDATVRELYRERLDEIDREIVEGRLTPEARQDIVAELDAALLDDFRGNAEEVPRRFAHSRMQALIIAGLIPVAAVLLYGHVGDPTAGSVIGAKAVLRLNPQSDGQDLTLWRDRLAERVAARPDDAHSWYLLGHAALKLGSFQQAAEAFEGVRALRGGNLNIDVPWLQAKYLAAGGVLDESTRSVADRLLASQPNQPLVLELVAIDAYRRGDFRRSVELLSRALSGNVNAEQREALTNTLAQARLRLGNLQPSLDVAVSTDGRAPQGATLFVIARPEGGGMPYAVVRRSRAEFPLSVRLDDSVSMNPARRLSGADKVEVVVRLSRSGQPMAQPGDWEWRSAAIDVQALEQPLALVASLSAP